MPSFRSSPLFPPAVSRTALLLLLTAALPAVAQERRWLPPADLPRIGRSYGLGETEFMIAAYTANTPPSGRRADMWRFLDTIGVNVWHCTVESIAQLDSIVASPDRGRKRMILKHGPLYDPGFAREIRFYPFDSVQSPYWQSRFAWLEGGRTGRNGKTRTSGQLEQRYDTTNTVPGQTVAKWITYDWKPGQKYRYPYDETTGERLPDTAVQGADQFITDGWRNRGQDLNYYVAVTARLLEPSRRPAPAADLSVLEIDVIHEIPRGTPYRDARGRTIVNDERNVEILDTTLVVRRGDLVPARGAAAGAYREVSFPIDLTRSADGSPGPLAPGSASQRFDLRVRWTGAEKIGLRDIALRDRMGEQLLAENDSARAYRAGLVTELRRALYGPNLSAGKLRDAIIRIDSDHEPGPTEYAGFEYLNGMIRRTVRVNPSRPGRGGDSLPAHAVQTGGAVRHNLEHFHAVTSPEEITVEIGYLNNLRDDVKLAPDRTNLEAFSDLRDYGITVHKLPSIREHNGGSYHVPELTLDEEGVGRYEEMLQQFHLGRHIPDQDVPRANWIMQNPSLYGVGRAAILSREKGRRLVTIPGLIGQLHKRIVIDDIDGEDTTAHIDHILTHLPEASETRLMANLSLCYGARGLLYYWIGSYPHVLTPVTVEGREEWIGGQDSFGPTGLFTTDRFTNRIDYILRRNPWMGNDPVDTLRDLYVGWRNRMEELTKLNRGWLPTIGSEMAKRNVRWRDGYSVNFQALRPGNDADARLTPRPLPPNEIVTGVRAYGRGSDEADLPHETFVELGLFYTRPDRSSRRLDTNYIFVVNRRAFERPADIPADSERGRLMDALAETRRIELDLNLTRRDTSRPEYIRVREVRGDTSRLPLASGPRTPLDTIIRTDGTASLTLGPGRGALLEITYLRPGTGRIGWNPEPVPFPPSPLKVQLPFRPWCLVVDPRKSRS